MCEDDGSCKCFSRYFGIDCSSKNLILIIHELWEVCLLVFQFQVYCNPIDSCNGNGFCNVYGKCQCVGGYYGSDCSSMYMEKIKSLAN